MRHVKDSHHWIHGRVDDLGKMGWDNAAQAAKSVLFVAESGKKEFERRELEAEMQAIIAAERAEAQQAIEEASAMQVVAQRAMTESQRVLAKSQRAMAGIQRAINDARRQGYDEGAWAEMKEAESIQGLKVEAEKLRYLAEVIKRDQAERLRECASLRARIWLHFNLLGECEGLERPVRMDLWRSIQLIWEICRRREAGSGRRRAWWWTRRLRRGELMGRGQWQRHMKVLRHLLVQ